MSDGEEEDAVNFNSKKIVLTESSVVDMIFVVNDTKSNTTRRLHYAEPLFSHF